MRRTPNLQKLVRVSEGTPRNPKEGEVMSPKLLVISITYKTPVASQEPCKECLSPIGQLMDRRVF